MASKSEVTEETLDKLRLEMPVATQRLRQPVRFQLRIGVIEKCNANEQHR